MVRSRAPFFGEPQINCKAKNIKFSSLKETANPASPELQAPYNPRTSALLQEKIVWTCEDFSCGHSGNPFIKILSPQNNRKDANVQTPEFSPLLFRVISPCFVGNLFPSLQFWRPCARAAPGNPRFIQSFVFIRALKKDKR